MGKAGASDPGRRQRADQDDEVFEMSGAAATPKGVVGLEQACEECREALFRCVLVGKRRSLKWVDLGWTGLST
jgi:hypothetical protein